MAELKIGDKVKWTNPESGKTYNATIDRMTAGFSEITIKLDAGQGLRSLLRTTAEWELS